MDNELPKESEPIKHKHFPWRTLILSATVIVIVGFAFAAYLKTVKGVIQVADTTAKTVPNAAAKFMTGTITHTFVERITDISPTHGDILEVATSRSDETFSKSDPRSIFWETIPLGTTFSEIRVPATFRYHIRLSDMWRLAAKNQVCLVLAPPIRPSLPPSIHTDQMEKNTSNGWLRFNKDDNLAALERSITPKLEQVAGDAKHIKLVREACRQSVADFVKKWLMKEEYWRSDRFSSIVVIFPDETTINSDQELEQYHYEATVKLD